MAGGAEVDDLHTVRLSEGIHQHDILWLQISVDQPQALQLHQGCGHLDNDMKPQITHYHRGRGEDLRRTELTVISNAGQMS